MYVLLKINRLILTDKLCIVVKQSLQHIESPVRQDYKQIQAKVFFLYHTFPSYFNTSPQRVSMTWL